jgi:hypothetical protein
MRSKNVICILFISLLMAFSTVCLAEDSASPATANLTIPKDGLPEDFKLLAVLPEMDPQVNMTTYIEEFYGDLDIGTANASVGIYQWGEPGENYDAKITLIRLMDEEHAKDAISNFKSQETYKDQLARGLPIFGNATVNGHEALEVKDIGGDNSIRYLYLWNNGSTVAFVEGTGDMDLSRMLANATGL